ncbi:MULTISPECIES: hypothetical protein [Halococcus]|uniref:Glycosyltransferase RgtA/B/C/D-like domain-containing protein n=1 Tax=Halococcus salifodinae DSM 8989 TaxID=1227456 RepID=M0N7K7_9EURY|nr:MULTISPECIES: hypothetical protein [Halococcus]EMA53518.1 hypothetical protein C450_09417 [Halococcus salifodinae DSM 8989]
MADTGVVEMSDHFADGRSGAPMLVALLVGAALAVVVATAVVGVVTAIKGAYTVVGLALAAWLYSQSSAETASAVWEGYARRYGPRTVWLAAVCAVGISVVTGDRSIGLLIAFPIGFGFLGLQLAAEVDSRAILAQALALYGSATISKYLTNGFYYAGGDTLFHTTYVETLIRTGSVAGIPRYRFFPGFHLVVGSLDVLGGISAYDAIMLAGIVVYGLVIVCVFETIRVTTRDDRLAAFTAVGLVMVEPFLYYATYFFPETFAVAIATFALYIAYRANQVQSAQFRYSIVGVAVMAALVFTHHLTIVFFVPIVGILFLVTGALRRIDDRHPNDRQTLSRPRTYLVTVTAFGAFAYWSYRSTFLAELAYSVRSILRLSLFASDSGAPTPTYALGMELPALTPETALWGLLSTDGIYQIALVAVFALGLAAVVDHRRGYWPALPLFAVGVVGSVVMFRTPLALPGIDRAQLPIAVFFAVAIGIGLVRLARATGTGRTTLAVAVVIVAVLGTTAPLNYNAGDDLYALNDGPNLYELYPTPSPQKEFSTDEYRDLEATAAFLKRHNTTVYTFAVGSMAMQGFGVDARESASVTTSGIETGEGLFLYRDRFVGHRLSYLASNDVSVGELNIAAGWLNRTVGTTDKIYANGQGGLLWNPNGSVIAPRTRESAGAGSTNTDRLGPPATGSMNGEGRR